MYARDEQIQLHVPDADGFGNPQPCRRLTEKCVQIGPFTGTLRIQGTIDDTTWPEIHEEVGAGAGDGVFVSIPFALRAVRLQRDSIVGDPPLVTLSGLLIG